MDLGSPDTWRWLWLAAGVGFAVGEIAVAGSFFLLPFAVGAFVAALAALTGLAVAVEWLLFVVVSTAASLILWPLGRRLDQTARPSTTGVHRWVGREATVLQAIPAGSGETGTVRLEREEWRAESALGLPIPAGSKVLVNRVNGTRLVVLPLEDPPALDRRPRDDPTTEP